MQNLQYAEARLASNFRDYNTYCPHLLANQIFRSASLSLVANVENAANILNEYHISTVIDLRAPQEIKEHPYRAESLDQKLYIKAPFDPWNQPEWFEKEYHFGTNRAIAYRFFLMACQASFQLVIQQIIEAKGAVLLHCHAGKDRTGLVIGAIQLLLGVDRTTIEKDYMASGSDADLEVFQLLFEQVEIRGGIVSFFEYQGIDCQKQTLLIEKLLAI